MKKKITTLPQAEKYLEQFLSSKWSYTLGRMQKLVALLDNPQDTLRVIHIGGTAGKGSTCYIAASILETAGYKVGLHMSPHMISITERFMINRKPISDKKFVELLNSIIPAINNMKDDPPTYYEITVAMMFKYFAQENVDIAVVEVGLGGKLDGTNVLSPARHRYAQAFAGGPAVAVVNNVGLDHTEILGDTVEKIAADKREIMKTGRPAVSGVTQPSVRNLIIEKANSVHAPLFLLNRDFFAKNIKTKTYTNVAFSKKDFPIIFDYISDMLILKNIQCSLFGRHQTTNAAVAVTAVAHCGLSVPEKAIWDALKNIQYIGRLERTTIGKTNVLIDGAHNPMKMAALSQALTDHFPGIKFPTLLAVKGDKDCREMISILAPHVSHWYVTTLIRQTDWGKRVMFTVDDLAKIIREVDPKKPLTEIPDFQKFLTSLSEKYLLITGSLYLVGAVEEWKAQERNR